MYLFVNVIVWLSTLLEQYMPLDLGDAVISLAMDKLISPCTEYTFSFLCITLSIQKKFWRNFVIAGFTVSWLATLSHKSTVATTRSAICDLRQRGSWGIFHCKCIVWSQGDFSFFTISSSKGRILFRSMVNFPWRRDFLCWFSILFTPKPNVSWKDVQMSVDKEDQMH